MKTRVTIGISLVVLAMAILFSGQAQEAARSSPSPSTSPSPPLLNPLKVALLKWYQANLVPTTFPVGQQPYGVAFDGANIWVTNNADGTVSKLRASDGAALGTFSVGGFPIA